LYGDRHYGTFLGPGRAERINPAGSALKRGIVFSCTTTRPLHPAAPCRLSGTPCAAGPPGAGAGAEYALPVYEALKGVTINAAYQYGLENKLGSIARAKKPTSCCWMPTPGRVRRKRYAALR
jgi:predicted amidohydrolase YtcJ